MSVFDSHSASVYLEKKTDVAFRPFGLDLFDKLAKACKEVRARLENEQRLLGFSNIRMAEIPEYTVVTKLLSGLSSLTDPEKVKSLATLSDDEKNRLALLERQLINLQAN